MPVALILRSPADARPLHACVSQVVQMHAAAACPGCFSQHPIPCPPDPGPLCREDPWPSKRPRWGRGSDRRREERDVPRPWEAQAAQQAAQQVGWPSSARSAVQRGAGHVACPAASAPAAAAGWLPACRCWASCSPACTPVTLLLSSSCSQAPAWWVVLGAVHAFHLLHLLHLALLQSTQCGHSAQSMKLLLCRVGAPAG